MRNAPSVDSKDITVERYNDYVKQECSFNYLGLIIQLLWPLLIMAGLWTIFTTHSNNSSLHQFSIFATVMLAFLPFLYCILLLSESYTGIYVK